MPSIDVDDFVYGYVAAVSTTTGENPSAFLRRLIETSAGVADPLSPRGNGARAPRRVGGELARCLDDPRLGSMNQAVDRFLAILSCVCQQDPEAFASKALTIGGTKRRYFGRSAAEIETTGTSINAKQIPNTTLWVDTNNDTGRKRRMIAEVLDSLGYLPATVSIAGQIVEHGRA